jgi:hypothetical protein
MKGTTMRQTLHLGEVEVDAARLVDALPQYQVRELSLFGSAAPAGRCDPIAISTC